MPLVLTRPLPFLPAGVKPRMALFVCFVLQIQFRLGSDMITGLLGLTIITSNHLCRPSSPTQYDPRTSRFGYFLEVLSSAILWMFFLIVILRIPFLFGLRPFLILCFLRPPFLTFARTITNPGLAL